MVLRTKRVAARPIRTAIVHILSLVLGMLFAYGATAAEQAERKSSGLPVPRFVSLKSDKVNVRGGPAKDHDVSWIFTRSGLPVEITAEYDNWRRIRDWEGAEGWVYHSLLSGRRTAIVTASPKLKENLLDLREEPRPAAAVVARLQPGVLGHIKQCNGAWCRVTGNGFDGWLEQERLWGVYPSEKVE